MMRVVVGRVSMQAINYFRILDLNECFDMDGDIIEEKYLYKQKLLHPDRIANLDDNERKLLSLMSDSCDAALVNEAYLVLKSPVKRAAHLLYLNNINVSDQVLFDTDVLNYVMDVYDRLDEVCNYDELVVIQNEVKSKFADYLVTIKKYFMDGDLSSAAQCYIYLKYLDKLRNDVKGVVLKHL